MCRKMFELWTLLPVLLGLINHGKVAHADPVLQFAPGTYNFTLEAVLPINYVIIQQLTVMFNSTPSSDQLITMTCVAARSTPSGACVTFGLSAIAQDNTKWVGNLVLLQTLNFQLTPVYNLVLQASNTIVAVSQNILINVIDKVPPVFVSSLVASVNELAATNQFITTLSAVDGDSSLKRPINYFIAGNSADNDYFTLDQQFGRLFNAKPFTFQDPIWANGYVTINVQAVVVVNSSYIPRDDPKLSTTVTVTVNLFSLDTAPVFSVSSFNVYVKQFSQTSSAIPGLVLVVTSANQGIGSVISLSLDNYNNYFAVTPNNGSGSITANVVLLDGSLLNYEVGPRVFTFNVIAKNSLRNNQQSSSASVTVNVVDTNVYPPMFSKPYYSTSVSELATSGTRVIQVLAYNNASNPVYGNSSIRYKIEGPGSNQFRMNPTTGQLTLAPCSRPGCCGCIDYEVLTVYNLSAVAANEYGEGHLVLVPLFILVINENDNPPIFTRNQFVGSIQEYAATMDSVLQISATDSDGNAQTYSISSNTSGIWTVGTSSGIINNTRPITYADTPGGLGYFLFSVVSTDGKYNANSTVRIDVIPVNMYAPVFEYNGSYTENLPANALPGTTVLQLVAQDKDSPLTPGGQVQYRISSTGTLDNFVIDSRTGVLTVSQGANLLKQSVYTFTVSATDGGQPQRSGTASVTVNILPPNYDRPVFVPSVVTMNVAESAPIGQIVAPVAAYDSSPNASLRYYLNQPITAFDINSQPVQLTAAQQTAFILNATTGLVIVNGALSRDQFVKWQAVITAVDVNSSPQETGTGTLVVNVVNVNSLPPVFISPWTPANPFYSITIPDQQPTGSYVTTMIANDPDNNIVTYSLINSSSPGIFTIVPTTGVVQTNSVLTYDASNSSLYFVVTAADNGIPSLTSTATVNVQLIPRNLNAPVFHPSIYSANISWTSPPGTNVVQVNATFANSALFGPVGYALPDDYNGLFVIDPVTGVISVAPGANLNIPAIRDAGSVSLLVSATNQASDPSQRRTSFSTVVISFNEFNKNPPVFTQSQYSTTIPDTADAQQIVLQVNAGTSGSLVYRIQSASTPGLFEISNLTGVITTAVPMKGYDGTYNLVVNATSNGQFATAVVTINVISFAQQPPQWTNPPISPYEIQIREDLPLNSVIFTAAVNITSTPNRTITFSMSGAQNQPVSDFNIDERTGVISTANSLNYDVDNSYLLKLSAFDAVTNLNSTRYLWIRVIPVTIPVFNTVPDCCSVPYNFSVGLTAVSGTSVGPVMATPDPARRASINYKVLRASSPYFDVDPNSGMVYVNSTSFIGAQLGLYTVVIRATIDGNYGQYQKLGCACVNRSDVTVNIYVYKSSEQNIFSFAHGYYNACLTEDAEINDTIDTGLTIQAINAGTGQVDYSIAGIVASFPNGAQVTVPNDLLVLRPSPTGSGTALYVNKLVYPYTLSYLNVTLLARLCRLTCDQYTTTYVRVWVAQPRYEILVTTKTDQDSTLANWMNIERTIKSNLNESNAQVCLVQTSCHVETVDEPSPGRRDCDKTDLYMYVVDGQTGFLLTNFHKLDRAYDLSERDATSVIGITAAYPFWAYFDYIPIAAAVGLIIALLILAILLLLCCAFWSVLLICWKKYTEKEPAILLQPAGPPPVYSAAPTDRIRRLQEDQFRNMQVDDDLDLDGTATAWAYGNQAYDFGDADIIGGTMKSSQHLLAETAAKSRESRSVSDITDVHIVAPLVGSRPVIADEVDNTPPPPVSAVAGNNLVSTHETTTHYEERRFQVDDRRPLSDAGMPSGSVAGYSGLDAPRPLVGVGPPSESLSPSNVVLNDPSRGNNSARIGATLYQAPSPLGGFAPTQNVVSAAPYPSGTMGTTSSLPLQHEMSYDDTTLQRPYDPYYDVGRPRTQSSYDGIDAGVYQGEIRLGTMASGRPANANRSSSHLNAPDEYETRYL